MVFLFILFIIFIIFITSKIRIEINNLKFSSKTQEKYKNNHLNSDFTINVKFLVLKLIPIAKLSLDKEKIKNIKQKSRFKKLNWNMSKIKEKLSIKKLKEVNEKINLKIDEFYLKIYLGTDSTIFTTITIPILSTIIAIILAKKKVNIINQKYHIIPIYNSGNLLNITFSGIFEIKMIHIIKVIFIINKKRRVDKNERTSNRRSYDYSYE